MPFLPNEPAPPTELAVVGENKDDPDHLLLMSPDGTYYAYTLPQGNTHEVDPDDSWSVDAVATEELFT